MKIAEKLPMVVSVMQNINAGKTSLIWGDQTTLLAGKPTITEELDGLVFDLSARAFFQLNPQQTKKLYRLAREALNLAPNETLVDAYSGVGTIGLSLADVAKEVRGMDTIPAAVADANANAHRKNSSTFHATHRRLLRIYKHLPADIKSTIFNRSTCSHKQLVAKPSSASRSVINLPLTANHMRGNHHGSY